jgi:hypothetical protein
VSYIVDADIRSFFDSISQQWPIRFLEHRVGDRRIVRGCTGDVLSAPPIDRF